MLYLITRGSKYDPDHGVQTVLEGPEGFDLDALWLEFERRYESVIGPWPQQLTETEEDRRQVASLREARTKRKSDETSRLSQEFDVKDDDEGWFLTRCFVASLVRDHGFIQPAYSEVHTE